MRTLTRIEIISGPDDLGRYVHFRFWMADYHPGHPDGEHRLAERGQVFRSRLPPRKAGVKVVDLRQP